MRGSKKGRDCVLKGGGEEFLCVFLKITKDAVGEVLTLHRNQQRIEEKVVDSKTKCNVMEPK